MEKMTLNETIAEIKEDSRTLYEMASRMYILLVSHMSFKEREDSCAANVMMAIGNLQKSLILLNAKLDGQQPDSSMEEMLDELIAALKDMDMSDHPEIIFLPDDAVLAALDRTFPIVNADGVIMESNLRVKAYGFLVSRVVNKRDGQLLFETLLIPCSNKTEFFDTFKSHMLKAAE